LPVSARPEAQDQLGQAEILCAAPERYRISLRGIMHARISAAGHLTGITFKQMTSPGPSTLGGDADHGRQDVDRSQPVDDRQPEQPAFATAAGITAPPRQ
jgi:hypothetical protein